MTAPGTSPQDMHPVQWLQGLMARFLLYPISDFGDNQQEAGSLSSLTLTMGPRVLVGRKTL
jgi:hypothetical protein